MLNRFIKKFSFALLILISIQSMATNILDNGPAPKLRNKVQVRSTTLNMYISPNGPISECEGTRIVLVVNGANPNASFQWTIGGTDINNSDNDSLLVLTSGTYNCIVTSPGNSTPDTLNDVAVTIDPKPVASFTYTTSGTCRNTVVNFTNTSTIASGSIVTKHWDFGDGNNSNQSNPSHTYNPSSGNGSATYTVRLIVTSDQGCKDTTTTVISVGRPPDPTLGGPGLATINGHPTFKVCTTTASNFTFINASSTTASNTSYTINWGDGSSNYSSSTFSSPIIHTYAVGTWALLFTVSNGSCTETQEYDIFVGNNPAGGLVSPGGTTICSGNSQDFLISGASNNPLGTTYTLSFNDGSTAQTYQHPAPDTVVHTFNSSSCGNTSSTGVTNFPNSFGAYLTISNPCGTTGGSVLPIYVSRKPVPSMNITPKDTICKGQVITFSNAGSVGYNVENGICTWGKYVWRITPNTPGTRYTVIGGTRFLGNDNGSTNPALWVSGDSVLNIRFDSVGTYTVSLVMANSTLCGSDSVVKTVCVNPTPVANFDVSTTAGCAPLTVSTVNNSSVANCGQNKYAWSVVYTATAGCTPAVSSYSYSGGTSSTSATPIFNFTNPGSYEIKLFVIAPATACSSLVASKTVVVKGKPVNTLTAVSAICISQTFSPSISSTCYIDGSSTYSWSFPTGTPNSSSSQSPGAINFSTSGAQNYSISVTNVCGTTTTNGSVTVNPLPTADAGPNKTTCSGVATSIGSAAVAGNTYSWSPTSNLSSSTAASPNVTISIPGTYTYVLTVTTTATGCIKKDTVDVTVNALPSVAVSPTAVSICAGGNTTLTASGADTYSWSPSTGLSATNVAVVTASPSATTTYTVTGTNTSTSCIKTASSVVTVNALPVVSAGPNITLCDQPIGTQLTGATPAGGTWSGPNVTSGGLFTPNGVGVFTLTYTYTNSTTGCFNSATRTVTVAAATQADAGADREVCLNSGNLSLTGSPSGGTWSGTNVTSAGVFSPISVDAFTLTYSLGAGTCLTTDQVVVTVNALPSVSVSPIAVSICLGDNTTLTASGADTYSWSPSTGLSATNVAVVTASPSATTTYIVTGTNTTTGCTKTATSVVTVNPVPVIANKNATACSGLSFTVTPVNGGSEVVPVGTTYTWTVVDNPNVTGESDQATGQSSISQLLTNNTNTAQTVVYTVTPKAGVCLGATFTVTVIVNPKPVIGSQTPVICSGGSFSVTPVDNAPTTIVPSNTLYTWGTPVISPAGSITNGTAQATGVSQISQTLNNITAGVATATYTVVPKAGTCTGSNFTVTVTVNPKPQIGNKTAVTCSGTAITLSPSTAGTDVVPSNTTYVWVITTDNANISGQSSESSPQSNFSQTLTSSSTSAQTIVYTVTPTSGAAGSCSGSTFTVTVTVNPKPVIQNETAVICSGQAFSVTPSASTVGNIIPAGTTYTWTIPVISPVGSISGGSAQTTAISSIGQTITNGTSSAGTATYTVTPLIGTCSGLTFTVTVTVNPLPSVSVSPTAVSICLGDNTTLTASGADTYSWSPSTGLSATNVAVVTASPSATTTYTVTGTNTTTGCTKTATSVVTVNPVPVIANKNATACSGSSFTVTPANGGSEVVPANTQYTWTVVDNPNTTGESDQATGQSNISQTITNLTNTVQTVVYTVTPKAGVCPGATFTVTVTVNPKPVIGAQTPAICSGGSFSVTPADNAPTTIVPSNTTYSWSAPIVTGGVTGGVAGTAQTSVFGTLTNPTNTVQTATYTVTPISGTCTGSTFIVTVTVNPKPVIGVQTPSICSGQTFTVSPANANPTAATIVPANTTYTWTVSNNANVTGQSDQAIGQNNISQTLTNLTNVTQTLVYTVTPTSGASGACPGATFTITVTVNPKPTILNETAIICSGTAFAVTPSTATVGNIIPVGTTYTWTSPIISPIGSVTGGLAQAVGQSSISQTLTNTTANTATATYTVTPTSGSTGTCAGPTFTVVVTVKPTPLLSSTLAPASVCSTTPFAYTATSATAGTTFSWVRSTVAGITNPAASGNTASINETLTNSTVNPVTVPYLFTLTATSCPNTQTVNLVVNPDAKAQFTIDTTIGCAPFILRNHLTLVPNVNANSQPDFKWYANGVLIGTGATVPAYSITTPGSTVIIKLFAKSKFNCKDDSTTVTINTIQQPVPSFTTSIDTACGPVSVLITNTTTPINVINGSSYSWNFGNGQTSTQVQPGNIVFQPNPSHRDTTYKITLSVTTACQTLTYIDSVTIRPRPLALFQIDTTVYCSPATIRFRNNSLGMPNRYIWVWGDGSRDTVMDNRTMYHDYRTGVPMSVPVKLIAQNECGIDSFTVTFLVNPATITPNLIVPGPNTYGCAPHPVTFVNNSVGGNLYTINFGDNTTPYITPRSNDTISHLYSSPGVYNVSLRSVNSCTDTTVIQQITVYQSPTASFTTDRTAYCRRAPVRTNNQSTPGMQYAWDFGDGSPIIVNVTNPVHYYQTAGTYTIQLITTASFASGSSCRDTATQQIVVNPLPTATFTSNLGSYNCAPFNFVGNATPANYSTVDWHFATASGTQLGSATGFTGTYLFSQPGNYNVTMIGFNAFGCSDTLQTPFTVSASPQVSFSVADTVYCGASATATFTNTTTYSGAGLLSYEWYVDGTLVSTSPNQLTYTFNTTPGINAPVNFTVRLIATASQTNCAPAYDRIITVLPVPQVNQPSNLVVCNGQSTNANFTTNNIGAGVTTYTWTNDRTSIGLAASGTGNISAFNAVNTGLSPVVANIVVTPHYTFGGKTCDGPTKTFTITVNPSAQVNQPANMTVCNDQLTGVNFTTNNIGGITTYSWTNNNSSIGILSTNTGSIPAFYAINAGNAPVVATIVVTPTFTNGGVSCTGPSKTFTITVLPTAQVDQPANQVVCNGQQTTFTFGSSNTGGVTTYRWTNNNATIGLAASGTGTSTTFTAVNTSLSPVIATITVTPTYTYNGNSCDGPSKSFTITVNPSGQVNQPLNQVVCNGSQTSFIEFTTNLIGGNTTYTWANTNTSIGLAAAGSGSIPAFTAINTGLAPVVATITVTPIFTDGGITCSGPTKSFTITINPSAQVNQPADQQICNGATTQPIVFSSVNTGGVVTYSWTNNTPSIGLSASGIGNIPAFVGVNLSAVPVVATITVTPTFTNSGVSCDGPSKIFRITVLPLPQPLIRVSPDSACAPMVVTFTNLTQYADTYQWFMNGTLFSTAHTPAPMVLTQAGTTYVFELLASNSQGGCGPVRATYTVKTLPTPRAGFNLNGSVADTIRACKSLQVVITNTSYLNSVGNTAGLNYQWYLNGVLQSFGGPNPSFFVQNTSHTRDSLIQVKLIVSSAVGCIDSLKKYVLLFPEPLASFSFNGGSSNCALPRNGLVKTVVNNSLVKNPGRYSWSVFNLTAASPSNGVIISSPTAFEPTFTFPDNLTNADTTYAIKLVVTSPDGCVKDTTINQIVYARPIVNFRITDSVSCTGQLSVSFLDLSVSPTSTITSRYWWFDDGGAFSTLPAVNHIYSNYGLYWPYLYVTNARGCVSDTMKKRIIVFGAPQAEFTAQSTVCLGTPVNFINASQLGWGSTSFSSVLWDFGDGTTSNLQTPTHTYANAGTYTITLSVKSDSSCVLSTKTRTIVVMGKPKADFTFSSRCAGVPINFINLTTVGYAENGYSVVGWNFGDGGQSLQTNPWHTYTAAGTYSVQLIVSGNNCPQLRDTVTKSLVIAFPRRDSIYPRVYATKLKRFTLTALPGGVSYVWTPNIGLIHPDRQITDAYYLRNDPSKILYNIAIKDSSGCIINDKQEVWVFEKPDVYAPTAFTPNGDRANDLFIPFYINIKTLKSFRIFNRWGEKIYETNSMTEGWDGTIKGQNAPLETYTWVVECYDVDGIKLVRNGMVTLIRN